MFSVAMATYNGEKYLAEQLRSLAEQTVLPDELVICDDTSTDSTADIVRLFAAGAPFAVRFVRNERRLGYHENFMKAARLCQGEYIAFCDQDDIWLKEKLAVAQKYINDTQCTLFQHGFRLIDGDGNVFSNDPDHWGPEGGGRWAMTRGMTQIFKRSFLSYDPLREISIDHCVGSGLMTHDQWILFINSLMGKVVTVKDVLVCYRQHGRNVFGFNSARDPKSNPTGTFAINASRLVGKSEAYRAKRAYLIAMMDRLAAGARSRAAIIELLERESPKERIAFLDENLDYYRRCAEYYPERMSIYTTKERFKRVKKFLSLYFKKSYQQFGSRGIKDSGLDVLYGVIR